MTETDKDSFVSGVLSVSDTSIPSTALKLALAVARELISEASFSDTYCVSVEYTKKIRVFDHNKVAEEFWIMLWTSDQQDIAKSIYSTKSWQESFKKLQKWLKEQQALREEAKAALRAELEPSYDKS